jgi:hypothetical protein
MRDFPVYLGFGLVLVIGLGLFALGARNLRRALASPHWPTASATVVESSTQKDVTAPSRSMRRRGGVSSVMYTANIKFQYEVNGRTYHTDQIYFGQTVGSGDSSEAELRRFRYPLGDKVTVWYDPSDPAIASVHPGFQAEALWLPGAGLAFLVPAVMAFVIFRSAFEGTSGMAVGLSIFTLVFMTIGAIILFFGGRAVLRAWQSQTWPTTRGVIVYGRIDESQSATTTTDDDEEYISTTTYNAPVVFRFEVDGKKHYSNTRRFGQLAGSDGEWASRIASLYPLGREVTVSYRPDSPDLATIEPGISSEAWWAPGAGAAFFLFGLAALVFGVPALTRF